MNAFADDGWVAAPGDGSDDVSISLRPAGGGSAAGAPDGAPGGGVASLSGLGERVRTMSEGNRNATGVVLCAKASMLIRVCTVQYSSLCA